MTWAYEASYRVYGARKIWRHLNRKDGAVARRTAERLMRELEITGAVRGKSVITTVPDASVQRAPDLVDRDFVAPALNRCRVADSTQSPRSPTSSMALSSWRPSPAVSTAGPQPRRRRHLSFWTPMVSLVVVYGISGQECAGVCLGRTSNGEYRSLTGRWAIA
ncbi:IS3 family transposase [Streptomyces caeruleatus]